MKKLVDAAVVFSAPLPAQGSDEGTTKSDSIPPLVSPCDPRFIIAGIRQFGLAPDGSDLRDLEAALMRAAGAGANTGTTKSAPIVRVCQKCGTPTNGEEALVEGKIWCHPCADAAQCSSEATREALIKARCCSRDGTVVNASMEDVLRALSTSSSEEEVRKVLERAAKIAEAAQLPPEYQWGSDAMEQFNFGKKRAAEAIRALAQQPEHRGGER
jgi:hypothetical protein